MNCGYWKQDPTQTVIEVIYWGACQKSYKYKQEDLRATIDLTKHNYCCEHWQELVSREAFRNKELVNMLVKLEDIRRQIAPALKGYIFDTPKS